MPDPSVCPPWLQADGRALLERSRQGRLPHAILLAGAHGIGKRPFSHWLAEALLCRQNESNGPCGQCESCLQIQAGAHPDYRRLEPEGANAAIKVDPIRDLVAWLQLTAGRNSYRVAVLEQADTMNRNAANSLLKTLEEPAENAVLILTATRSGALPATIRSRCQTINLKLHDRPAAVNWLRERLAEAGNGSDDKTGAEAAAGSAGASADSGSGSGLDPEAALSEAGDGPYAALAMQQAEFQTAHALLLKAWRELFLRKGSVGRISDSLADLDTALCLATFARWALLAAKTRSGLAVRARQSVLEVISETGNCLTIEQWFSFHEHLLQLHRADSASFKTQTVLEGFFADTRVMSNG